MAVAVLVKQPFDADAAAGAFLGVIVGFGLFAFFKLLFSRLKLFSQHKNDPRHTFGVFCGDDGGILCRVALILVDSGGEFRAAAPFQPRHQIAGGSGACDRTRRLPHLWP